MPAVACRLLCLYARGDHAAGLLLLRHGRRARGHVPGGVDHGRNGNRGGNQCWNRRLHDGSRKDGLLTAATEVFAAFSDYIEPFDAEAAIRYTAIVAHRDRLGLPIDGFDAQIAAICRTRGAALATRNAKDYLETGIDVIDLWQHRPRW